MQTILDSTLGQIKAATALGALALAGLVAFAPPAAAQLTDTTGAACHLDLDGDGILKPGQSGQQSDGPGGADVGDTDNAATDRPKWWRRTTDPAESWLGGNGFS